MPMNIGLFTPALRSALCAATVLLSTPASISAAILLPGFTETVVATGLQQPTAMALAPDGRIFVC